MLPNPFDIPHGGLVVGQLTGAKYQRIEPVKIGGHDMGGKERYIEFIDILGQCHAHAARKNANEGLAVILEYQFFRLAHGDGGFDTGIFNNEIDGTSQDGLFFFGRHLDAHFHFFATLCHNT